jgi:hypothetical protein
MLTCCTLGTTDHFAAALQGINAESLKGHTLPSDLNTFTTNRFRPQKIKTLRVFIEPNHQQ